MTEPPRWRLDAVALTLLTAGGLLTAAVATYAPLFGTPNLLGDAGDALAATVVEWPVAVR